MDRERTQQSPDAFQVDPDPALPAPAPSSSSEGARERSEPALPAAWLAADSQASDSLSPGTIIDEKYELEALLGSGGMSQVYEATNRLTRRRVALKFLRPGASSSLDPRRVLQEGRAIARIEHPNVVQVLDLGFHAGEPYLVVERLRGQPLSEHLQANGALSVSSALALIDPVLDACHRFHEAGVVHRDIKPGNLFLVEDGVSAPHLKILDFGVASLAPLVGDELESQKLTATGAAPGTPLYMAPEQLRRQKADARTDIFALGAILFEMLTGQRAFPAHDLTELVVLMVSEDDDARAERMERAVPTLGAVLARALAREPKSRFQSAEEFRQALRRILPGSVSLAARPVEARSPGASAAPHPRRPLGLSSDTEPAQPGPARLEPPRGAAARPGSQYQQRATRGVWALGFFLVVAAAGAAALFSARRQPTDTVTAAPASELESGHGSLQPPSTAPEAIQPLTEAKSGVPAERTPRAESERPRSAPVTPPRSGRPAQQRPRMPADLEGQ